MNWRSTWCRFVGKHKFSKPYFMAGIQQKICVRCGLTKPVKTRQQKRDEATRELTAKAKP